MSEMTAAAWPWRDRLLSLQPITYRCKPAHRRHVRVRWQAHALIWAAILEGQSYRCPMCGVRMRADVKASAGEPPDDYPTVEHIVPLAAGGADDIGNIVAACRRCNRDAGRVHHNAMKQACDRAAELPRRSVHRQDRTRG